MTIREAIPLWTTRQALRNPKLTGQHRRPGYTERLSDIKTLVVNIHIPKKEEIPHEPLDTQVSVVRNQLAQLRRHASYDLMQPQALVPSTLGEAGRQVVIKHIKQHLRKIRGRPLKTPAWRRAAQWRATNKFPASATATTAATAAAADSVLYRATTPTPAPVSTPASASASAPAALSASPAVAAASAPAG